MNCCNNIRNEKAMIMKNIYELGFALVETMLYLDTHPDAPSSPSGPPYCEIIIAASVGLQFFILIGY